MRKSRRELDLHPKRFSEDGGGSSILRTGWGRDHSHPVAQNKVFETGPRLREPSRLKIAVFVVVAAMTVLAVGVDASISSIGSDVRA